MNGEYRCTHTTLSQDGFIDECGAPAVTFYVRTSGPFKYSCRCREHVIKSTKDIEQITRDELLVHRVINA